MRRLRTALLVVLASADCGSAYEPTVAVLAAGRTGCPGPDRGGWTVWAELVEPVGVPDGRGLDARWSQ
jgi:hypothetical protein